MSRVRHGAIRHKNRLYFVMEQSRGTTVTCFTKVLDLTRLSRASFRRPALLKKNFDFSSPRGDTGEGRSSVGEYTKAACINSTAMGFADWTFVNSLCYSMLVMSAFDSASCN